MQDGNLFGLFLATLIGSELGEACSECRAAYATLTDKIDQLIVSFLGQPITPQVTFEFEESLDKTFREMARRIVEVVYNRIEAEDAQSMPQRAQWEGQEYCRKNQKSANRGGVGTLFGVIALDRFSYEPLQEAREDGQKSFAPLELLLGIVAGNATPALAERVGREAADQTQEELRERLRRDHNVTWSVDVLRKVTTAVSQGVAEFLHGQQKAQLIQWLEEANVSRGKQRIVLSVGRDGIMVPIRGETTYKEGSVATIAVYDRRGRRLGTVYLGQMPEAHQVTLSEQLTRLVKEVLKEWGGPWPRLVYVTDAGYHPTEYFASVLTQLDHPRYPGQRMDWLWIVDFYHGCEYITKLAHVLFDDSRAQHAWSRRMRHLLKHEPNAIFRIIHSAARYHSERLLTKEEEVAYQKAYNYLKIHATYMDYTTYRRHGLPIGSGVTEAACKTVFTQRFKESGMSWKTAGGQVILTLRVAKLSGVWATVFKQYLVDRPLPTLATKPDFVHPTHPQAA